MSSVETLRQRINALIPGLLPAPLEDSRYIPEHVPVKGFVPSVVEKWGSRSQLRWFRRYAAELLPQPYTVWARFYCSSLQHKGNCCSSCIEDQNEGYEPYDPDHCCCRAIREVLAK